MTCDVQTIDLGRLGYHAAYTEQIRHVSALIESRDRTPAPPITLLLVEHDPVITISRRAGAAAHLLLTPDALARLGIEIVETDRGGDITYHGPGQLVVYPILDLNRFNLGLHDYMRLLEEAVIRACHDFGVEAQRDASATGVWIAASRRARSSSDTTAKIAAMGVRVRKWVAFHGLAINVTTNLDHFDAIVPCGLVGRRVTSLEAELGPACPTLARVKRAAVGALSDEFARALDRASAQRAAAAEPVS